MTIATHILKMRVIVCCYWDFLIHPDWRGEKFTWKVPLNIARWYLRSQRP